MAHKHPGYKYEDDWTMDEMKRLVDSLTSGIIVPVNMEIKADQTVLNFDNVKKYVLDAKKIAILDCDCRMKKKHCNAPLDVCMVFDSAADRVLTSEKNVNQHPHEVNAKDAMKVLERSNKAGLVHMAYLSKGQEKVDTICSCCSCCCENFGATLRYGLAPHLYKASAKSDRDDSKCQNCGKCAERCHFGACELVNGKLVYNEKQCYGCGLCVSTCPTGAISLTQLS
jgi:Pyruvate/2-oxoacid:ferredoxin oxidoreductase delta subunit